jgi:glycosyltransferase involved in cell wall biosynthesis
MKLSIMIITYNRCNEVLRAVKSCLPFMNEDMELVIVDNNSSDETAEVLNSFLNSLTINHKLVLSKENLGVAGGRNLAFSLCKGDYVFSLDDDAIIVTEDFLIKMIQFMDTHAQVVAAEVNILEPQTETNLNSRFRYQFKNLDYEFIRSFCGCAHVLRREFYKGALLYPTHLFFGSEELYPSLKAWGSHQHVGRIEYLTVHHLPSKINRFSGKDRIFNILMNTYIVKRLMYPEFLSPLLKANLSYRLMKYDLKTKEWTEKRRVVLSERYIESEKHKISFKVILLLIRRFGFLAIL